MCIRKHKKIHVIKMAEGAAKLYKIQFFIILLNFKESLFQ